MKSKYHKIQQLQSFLTDQPEDPFLHFALAKEYEKLDLGEKAMQKYLELVHKFPAYVGTYYHFAQLLMNKKDNFEANRIIQKGIEIAQNQSDLHSLAELKNLAANLDLDI